MTAKNTEVMTENDIDAEIAALEAALESDEIEEIVEDPTDTVDDGDLEAAVAEVEMEEAKAEAYEEQESEGEMSTEPVEPKKTAKKAPRKTMTGAAKSAVIRDKLGEKLDEVLTLSTTESDKSDDVLATVDKMAKKVGEKAVNLFAHLNGSAKLSAYTEIAFKFLAQSEKGITAKELIEHFGDQKANGVKGYGIGTARSQGHQMFQLFPQLKIGVLNGKTMTLNPDSVIAATLKAEFGIE